jgi:hypothetical protein
MMEAAWAAWKTRVRLILLNWAQGSLCLKKVRIFHTVGIFKNLALCWQIAVETRKKTQHTRADVRWTGMIQGNQHPLKHRQRPATTSIKVQRIIQQVDQSKNACLRETEGLLDLRTG